MGLEDVDDVTSAVNGSQSMRVRGREFQPREVHVITKPSKQRNRGRRKHKRVSSAEYHSQVRGHEDSLR